jgi:hypothetical protein
MADTKKETPKAGAISKPVTSTVKAESTTKPQAPEGFKLVNWPGGHRIAAGKHGIVDLTDLSAARAGRLVDDGFKFLKRK